MSRLEKDIQDYFTMCFDNYEEVLLENSINSLVFSYLVGMHPEECRYMELETEMTPDQVEEYYNVEDCILRLKKRVVK